nr:hypothetical protein [Tanacetum cinerariifolium]
MGGSSSQPRTDRVHAPINAFSLKELYTPDFSEPLQENTDFLQAPNPNEVSLEQVPTSPTKKKATRNRQKKMIQSDDAPRQTPWTTKEEIVLCKGWLAISKKHGNSRKQGGFWIYNNIIRMGPKSGARDADYVQRAMIHYEIDTELPFKLRHYWEILKDHPKWQEIAISNFKTRSEGGSKRHKSTGSSSFNTESEEASINLNTNVDDNNEDEVQEIHRPRGRDKARAAARKNKGSKSSASSNINEDALAMLMVPEMTSQEKQGRLAFLDIKRREVKYHEQEIEQSRHEVISPAIRSLDPGPAKGNGYSNSMAVFTLNLYHNRVFVPNPLKYMEGGFKVVNDIQSEDMRIGDLFQVVTRIDENIDEPDDVGSRDNHIPPLSGKYIFEENDPDGNLIDVEYKIKKGVRDIELGRCAGRRGMNKKKKATAEDDKMKGKKVADASGKVKVKKVTEECLKKPVKWTRMRVPEHKGHHCPFRLWASWMSSERWIARHYERDIILNSGISYKFMREDIREKYMVDVSLGKYIPTVSDEFQLLEEVLTARVILPLVYTAGEDYAQSKMH